MTDQPTLVLVETGVKAEGLASNVLVTKDMSVTTVTLTWDEPDTMDAAFIDDALDVLGPVASDHPRFATVVQRLLARRVALSQEVNGA